MTNWQFGKVDSSLVTGLLFLAGTPSAEFYKILTRKIQEILKEKNSDNFFVIKFLANYAVHCDPHKYEAFAIKTWENTMVTYSGNFDAFLLLYWIIN